MKALIIEDKPSVVEELRKEILPHFGKNEVRIVESMRSALDALTSDVFDVILLDRKIPSQDGALDDDVSHGEVVYEHVREHVRGSLVFFWTAYAQDEYIAEKIDRDVRREDVWGGREFPTVGLIPKARFDKLRETLTEIKGCVDGIAGVEIRVPPGKDFARTSAEETILRIFGRRIGGSAVEARLLSGGLSSSKVLRVKVLKGNNPIANAVAKISTVVQAEREHRRQQPVKLLPAGAATQIMLQVRAGAGAVGATFYRDADNHEKSLFQLLREKPDIGREVVKRLQASFEPWIKAARDSSKTIQEVRRLTVADAIFEEVKGKFPDLKLEEFEKGTVDFLSGHQHGDLHGGNILIDSENRPILIDYGEVDERYLALDPTTLELSLIFHPDGISGDFKWPTVDQARAWADVKTYTQGSHIGEFVAACREWAYDVAPGNRAQDIACYCYLLRQFKYPKTDKGIAAALLQAVVADYRQR